MGGRKQGNLGSMANIAREQAKYDLGSREQLGAILEWEPGAWDPPYRGSLFFPATYRALW